MTAFRPFKRDKVLDDTLDAVHKRRVTEENYRLEQEAMSLLGMGYAREELTRVEYSSGFREIRPLMVDGMFHGVLQ